MHATLFGGLGQATTGQGRMPVSMRSRWKGCWRCVLMSC